MRVFPILPLALLTALGDASQAPAAPPRLDLPVLCTIGTTCFVQKYVDQDPGPGYADFMCGDLASPDHRGTDFRVPTLADMKEGVAVVAAADGVVRAVRDGMADVTIAGGDKDAIAGREAGNVVVLRHHDGWETYYAHLQNGSLTVRKGDMVQAGQRLGLIGLSGNTEYPHLHFGVLHDGKPVDPFVGEAPPPGCGDRGTPLWTEAAQAGLPYIPAGLLSAGWHDGVPETDSARAGTYATEALAADAPALVFWVDLFGVRKGDLEVVRIIAPDGSVLLDHRGRIEKTQAQSLRYFGKKRTAASWPAGPYRAEYALLRQPDNASLIEIVRSLDIR
ncbi:MAG: peptidase [Rhodospirillaceae bacterium]|nr:peptidase [Rhodospirillaceae bacterium]|tara:strand:- start:182 stop:1183 length:1002 start_codon:yes stop_codon:yes gene_type:complete